MNLVYPKEEIVFNNLNVEDKQKVIDILQQKGYKIHGVNCLGDTPTVALSPGWKYILWSRDVLAMSNALAGRKNCTTVEEFLSNFSINIKGVYELW